MKTLALVLGNDNYFVGDKLDNPINDATSIKETFEKLGFEVIFKIDFKKDDIGHFLLEFEDKISNYDASICYFAGHGFELDGENYLVPIDIQVQHFDKSDARYCLRLSEILDILKKHSKKVHIVIIDACRKNFDRGGAIGFSHIQAPKGTLLAFSTSPSKGASDIGMNGHSIYTGALLQYIGRKRLSVETLFKEVRKTVFNLSNGTQITWEHTSLIDDYYFNEGQMVYSIDIPYNEKVIKDVNYEENDNFGILICDLKSGNWNLQNPAINNLLLISVNNLDKNQQFILGRNLLQASSDAFGAQSFMQDIQKKIQKYNFNHQNHVLNGILFEIYFNKYGEFRKNETKKHYFEEVINLRKIPELKNSFDFIGQLLTNQQYSLIYIPQMDDEFLDIDISATEEKIEKSGVTEQVQVINSIMFKGNDITEQIAKIQYGIDEWYFRKINEQKLTQNIADFLSSPLKLIQIHSNIEIINANFANNIFDDSLNTQPIF